MNRRAQSLGLAMAAARQCEQMLERRSGIWMVFRASTLSSTQSKKISERSSMGNRADGPCDDEMLVDGFMVNPVDITSRGN